MTLDADPDLLTQAIINLLHNAIDAVGEVAEPRIRLSCIQDDEHTVIAVEDNGLGLPPDRTDTIFVPFLTTKPGGSGNGLSLARQIALSHGGQIEVEPNRPRGTIFRIILPVRQA